jgi:hypothetical protein
MFDDAADFLAALKIVIEPDGLARCVDAKDGQMFVSAAVLLMDDRCVRPSFQAELFQQEFLVSVPRFLPPSLGRVDVNMIDWLRCAGVRPKAGELINL